MSRCVITREWTLEPWCVFGGWIVVSARWIRDPRDGWDQEHELLPEVSTVLHATRQDAATHIARIRAGA